MSDGVATRVAAARTLDEVLHRGRSLKAALGGSLPGLDDLGLPFDGDIAAVTRAILDGEHVALDVDGEHAWPLPAPG